MALVEQRELLEEFFQAEYLAHLVETVLIPRDARLGVERVDESIGDALAVAAAHILLEFLGFEDSVLSCRPLEDVMDLSEQHGLTVGIGQVVDDEILLLLAFPTPCISPIWGGLDGDGPHVDELQDAG